MPRDQEDQKNKRKTPHSALDEDLNAKKHKTLDRGEKIYLDVDHHGKPVSLELENELKEVIERYDNLLYVSPMDMGDDVDKWTRIIPKECKRYNKATKRKEDILQSGPEIKGIFTTDVGDCIAVIISSGDGEFISFQHATNILAIDYDDSFLEIEEEIEFIRENGGKDIRMDVVINSDQLAEINKNKNLEEEFDVRQGSLSEEEIANIEMIRSMSSQDSHERDIFFKELSVDDDEMKIVIKSILHDNPDRDESKSEDAKESNSGMERLENYVGKKFQDLITKLLQDLKAVSVSQKNNSCIDQCLEIANKEDPMDSPEGYNKYDEISKILDEHEPTKDPLLDKIKDLVSDGDAAIQEMCEETLMSKLDLISKCCSEETESKDEADNLSPNDPMKFLANDSELSKRDYFVKKGLALKKDILLKYKGGSYGFILSKYDHLMTLHDLDDCPNNTRNLIITQRGGRMVNLFPEIMTEFGILGYLHKAVNQKPSGVVESADLKAGISKLAEEEQNLSQ